MKNATEVIKAAIDGGNSSLKVIVNARTPHIYPNVSAANNNINYGVDKIYSTSKEHGRDLWDVKVTTDLDKDEQSVYSHVFGKMAEKFSSGLEHRSINTLKSQDMDLKRNLITALAGTIASNVIEGCEKIDCSKVDVDLAVGLPYKEYLKGNGISIENYSNNLLGTHKVEFNSPYFKENKISKITLNIRRVEVLIEGKGALTSMVFSGDDKLVEDNSAEALSELDGVYTSSIDIGNGSTEIITNKFNAEYNVDKSGDYELAGLDFIIQPDYCTGTTKGIGHVIDDCIESLNKSNSQVGEIKRIDIENSFKMPTNKGILRGSKIDVNPYFKEHAIAFANDLANKYINMFAKIADKTSVKRIYITGGGSFYNTIVDTFKKRLIEKGFDGDAVRTPRQPSPLTANVLGYYEETFLSE